eukprot:4062608-Pyramimonas_sp.AAC.1
MAQEKGAKHIVAHQDLRVYLRDKFPRLLREMHETIDSPFCRDSGPYGPWPTWDRTSAPRAFMGKSESHSQPEACPYRYPWQYRMRHV